MEAPIDRLFSLAGRTALVTGATRGIGLAIARTFAAAGARVLVHGRDESSASEVAATIAGAVPIALDLGDPLSMSEALERVLQTGHQPDILVLNAGMRDRRAMEDVDIASFESVMRVNVSANQELLRLLAPGMAARGWGRLIFVASVGAHLANGYGPGYAASKAAVLALMRTTAVRFGPRNVTSNAISPGVVATEFNRDLLLSGRMQDSLAHRIPLRRAATPEEIAASALFLASEAAAYVNGQDLVVDGGWTIAL